MDPLVDPLSISPSMSLIIIMHFLNASIPLTAHIDHLSMPFRVFLWYFTVSVHDALVFLQVSSNGGRFGHGLGLVIWGCC